MRISAINELRCPVCRGDLILHEIKEQIGENIKEATLVCSDCDDQFPIMHHIPRFVPADNYSASFGLQWNRHARTQLDKFNGTTLSRDRFYGETRWHPSSLQGEKILEVGCGAGRFTQVALDAGASVYSLDYSAAVDACLSNNGPHDKLFIVQGDLYRIPFPQGYFDKLFCLGVLQHTPDVEEAFHSLIPYLKSGGEIVVDLYPLRFFSLIHPRYLLRPVTKRMNQETLYGLIVRWAPRLLGISNILGKVPLIGIYLARLIPIANYTGKLPLSEEQVADWAVLNTFDWFSPKFEKPQRLRNITRWFREAGLQETSIRLVSSGDTGKGGVFVGSGVKP